MKKREPLLYRILPLISILALLGLWLLLCRQEDGIMPTPMEVAQKITYITVHPISKAVLPVHILVSLARVLGAFLIASVLGVAFGVAMGRYQTAHDIVWPVFEIIRPIPPIAWIPLIILWCGIGETSKVVIVLIGTIVPIILNTYAGIRQVDPMYLKAAKTLAVPEVALMTEVILPASLASILAGMKTALSTGWMCVLAAEMVVAKQGVGFLIIRGMDSGDSALIVAGMIVIGVVSALITAGLNLLEVKLCPWKAEQK